MYRTGVRFLRVLCPALLIAGCSDPETLVVEVMTGQETDTFSLDPAVTRVELRAVGNDGANLGSASAAPGGELSLGTLSTETLARFEVHGYDVDGDLRVRGRSLSVVLGGIESGFVPVFAQRVERWSRPPGALDHSHVRGVGGVLAERYLMLTGGEGLGGEPTQITFYDLLSWGGSEGPTLNFAPESLVVSADARAALVIAGERAQWVEFDNGVIVDVELPEGLSSFAEVSGGRTVVGSEAAYVVGATRDGSATDRVLVVEADRSLRTARLVRARAGAAAVWVEGEGLVVAGGSAESPGVEVLSYNADDVVLTADPRPFAIDEVAGATAVAVNDGAAVWLLCGATPDGTSAGVRQLDLAGCIDDCAPTEVFDQLVDLTRCNAFSTPSGVLLTGDTAAGETVAFKLSADGQAVAPLGFREPRFGATTVAAPNGTLAVLGGGNGTDPVVSVELLFPTEE